MRMLLYEIYSAFVVIVKLKTACFMGCFSLHDTVSN